MSLPKGTLGHIHIREDTLAFWQKLTGQYLSGATHRGKLYPLFQNCQAHHIITEHSRERWLFGKCLPAGFANDVYLHLTGIL